LARFPTSETSDFHRPTLYRLGICVPEGTKVGHCSYCTCFLSEQKGKAYFIFLFDQGAEAATDADMTKAVIELVLRINNEQSLDKPN
jgi:hypothetical protein